MAVVLFCGVMMAQFADVISAGFGYQAVSSARKDDALYITHSNGMTVLDISDRDNPVEVMRFYEDIWSGNIFVMGDTLVKLNGRRFTFYDISEPLHPELTDYIDADLRTTGKKLFIENQMAYVVFPWEGMDAIDLREGHAGERTGSIRPGPTMWDFELSMILHGDYLYFNVPEWGLYFYNISDPDTLVLEDSIDDGIGELTFTTYDEKLMMISRASFTVSTFMPVFSSLFGFSTGRQVNCFHDGYAWAFGDSTTVFDLGDFEDESDIRIIADLSGTMVANPLDDPVIVDNRMYILDQFYGLRIIDISEPAEPHVCGGLVTSLSPKSVRINAADGYVLSETGDLYAVDFSDIHMPCAGIEPLENCVDWFTIQDSYLLAAKGSALQIYRQSDSGLELLTSIPGLGDFVSAKKRYDFLFAAHGEEITVFDLVDITDPHEVASIDTDDDILAMNLRGGCLYILTRGSLKIYDVSMPSVPDYVSSFPVETSWPYVSEIEFNGSRLYFSTGTNIECYDISSPESPVLLGSHDASSVSAFDLTGDLAVITNYSGGFIIDFSDPDSTVETRFYPNLTIDDAYDIEIADSIIWVCRGIDGLFGYDFAPYLEGIEEPTNTVPDAIEITVSPNPFNAACHIDIPQEFTADIYDIHGRHVHILPDGSTIWNADGQPSGVYLMRAHRGEKVLEKRVVLVK